MKFQTRVGMSIMLLSLVLVASCGQGSDDPIRIGALLPLTGGLAAYGESAQMAIDLAVGDINSRGGINGRMIAVEYQDHRCDPKTAVTAYEELAGSKQVDLFVSVACSGTVLALAPRLDTAQSILIGTTVSTPKVSGISPFVFRNWASDSKEAALFAKKIKKEGYHSVAVLFEQTDYAQGLRTSLEIELNGSGIGFVAESFAPGDTDVRSQLAKLSQAAPQVLFISPQTMVSADMVLKQLGESMFRPEMILVNDNIIKAQQVVKDHAVLLEGAFGGDYVPSRSNDADQVLGRIEAKATRPCPAANVCLGQYDAMNLLAEAIKEQGDDPVAIKSYLGDVRFQGVTGEISFDEQNDRVGAEYALFVVQDGRAVPQ